MGRPGLVEGQVVVVTGGSSGIGREVCLRAASEGAKAVVIASLRETSRDGLGGLSDLIEQRGAAARFVRTDVADPTQFAAVVAAVPTS